MTARARAIADEIAAQERSNQAVERALKPRKRHLTCCCCGDYAGRWQQWWNRDAGFGICPQCVAWQASRGTSPEEIRDCYGEAGIHYAIPKESSNAE